MITRAVLAFAFLVASFGAQATMLTNGSFEDLGGQTLDRSSDRWDYFATIPGWVGVNHLEIHRGDGSSTFVTPQDGEYYAELNAHPSQDDDLNFQLQQTFATVAGQAYNLEFYAQARRDNDGNFFFSVGNLTDVEINNHETGSWTQYSFDFIATGISTTLSFISGQSGSDTVGHYLDNVSVTPVPTPGTISLLSASALALVFWRRRLAKKASA